MPFRTLFNPFASFRAQLVAFITCMLVLTTVVLYVFNRRSEQRITQQVDDYIQATIQATDIALRSLSEGRLLSKLVDPQQEGALEVNAESIIRHILIVDSVTKEISDSTDPQDRGKQLDTAITDLPSWSLGDLKQDEGVHADDRRDRTIQFTFETDRAKRTLIIVISKKRFSRVIDEAARDRLAALVILGLLMVVLIAIFSQRFTRPILNLEQAAQRVTAGDLDSNVTVSGPKEVSTLSTTFNEMLTGLRRNRELEEQLQRAERSAVVGRLASGIAHEIRNPLNFMNLSIDHLQAACAPEDARKRSEFSHILTTIKEEISRLNRLVSDFLSYGRPARLKTRELDARALIEEVSDLVKAQAEQQGVKVKVAADSHGSTKFQADYEQIKTCFSNLMINAVQAMPEGGALNVTVHPNESSLHIEFADTGTGIAPENLAQIFEPYYSTKDTGIGLGLPLTKKIIEEHGGQITVESEPGHGTTFTVTLPRRPA
jgi:signal transduction histidine kinase